MVVNEKALIRLMKKDYRGSGYRAAKTLSREDETEVLELEGADWSCQISWENIPNAVLGVIAVHLKTIPQMGECFVARRDDVHMSGTGWLEGMPEIKEDEKQVTVHRTPIVYDGHSCWQKYGNNGIVMVPVETDELLLDFGREPILIDCGIYLEGKCSKVHVVQRSVWQLDEDEAAINYLSGRRWRG